MKARRTRTRRPSRPSQGGFADLMSPSPSSTPDPTGVITGVARTAPAPSTILDTTSTPTSTPISTPAPAPIPTPPTSTQTTPQPPQQQQQQQDDWESLLAVPPKRKLSPLSKSSSFSRARRSPSMSSTLSVPAQSSLAHQLNPPSPPNVFPRSQSQSQSPATNTTTASTTRTAKPDQLKFPSISLTVPNDDAPLPSASVTTTINHQFEQLVTSNSNSSPVHTPSRQQPDHHHNRNLINVSTDTSSSNPEPLRPTTPPTTTQTTMKTEKDVTNNDPRPDKQSVSLAQTLSTSSVMPAFLSGWDGVDGWGDDKLDDTDPDDDDNDESAWTSSWTLPSEPQSTTVATTTTVEKDVDDDADDDQDQDDDHKSPFEEGQASVTVTVQDHVVQSEPNDKNNDTTISTPVAFGDSDDRVKNDEQKHEQDLNIETAIPSQSQPQPQPQSPEQQIVEKHQLRAETETDPWGAADDSDWNWDDPSASSGQQIQPDDDERGEESERRDTPVSVVMAEGHNQSDLTASLDQAFGVGADGTNGHEHQNSDETAAFDNAFGSGPVDDSSLAKDDEPLPQPSLPPQQQRQQEQTNTIDTAFDVAANEFPNEKQQDDTQHPHPDSNYIPEPFAAAFADDLTHNDILTSQQPPDQINAAFTADDRASEIGNVGIGTAAFGEDSNDNNEQDNEEPPSNTVVHDEQQQQQQLADSFGISMSLNVPPVSVQPPPPPTQADSHPDLDLPVDSVAASFDIDAQQPVESHSGSFFDKPAPSAKDGQEQEANTIETAFGAPTLVDGSPPPPTFAGFPGTSQGTQQDDSIREPGTDDNMQPGSDAQKAAPVAQAQTQPPADPFLDWVEQSDIQSKAEEPSRSFFDPENDVVVDESKVAQQANAVDSAFGIGIVGEPLPPPSVEGPPTVTEHTIVEPPAVVQDNVVDDPSRSFFDPEKDVVVDESKVAQQANAIDSVFGVGVVGDPLPRQSVVRPPTVTEHTIVEPPAVVEDNVQVAFSQGDAEQDTSIGQMTLKDVFAVDWSLQSGDQQPLKATVDESNPVVENEQHKQEEHNKGNLINSTFDPPPVFNGFPQTEQSEQQEDSFAVDTSTGDNSAVDKQTEMDPWGPPPPSSAVSNAIPQVPAQDPWGASSFAPPPVPVTMASTTATTLSTALMSVPPVAAALDAPAQDHAGYDPFAESDPMGPGAATPQFSFEQSGWSAESGGGGGGGGGTGQNTSKFSIHHQADPPPNVHHSAVGNLPSEAGLSSSKGNEIVDNSASVDHGISMPDTKPVSSHSSSLEVHAPSMDKQQQSTTGINSNAVEDNWDFEIGKPGTGVDEPVADSQRPEAEEESSYDPFATSWAPAPESTTATTTMGDFAWGDDGAATDEQKDTAESAEQQQHHLNYPPPLPPTSSQLPEMKVHSHGGRYLDISTPVPPTTTAQTLVTRPVQSIQSVQSQTVGPRSDPVKGIVHDTSSNRYGGNAQNFETGPPGFIAVPAHAQQMPNHSVQGGREGGGEETSFGRLSIPDNSVSDSHVSVDAESSPAVLFDQNLGSAGQTALSFTDDSHPPPQSGACDTLTAAEPESDLQHTIMPAVPIANDLGTPGILPPPLPPTTMQLAFAPRSLTVETKKQQQGLFGHVPAQAANPNAFVPTSATPSVNMPPALPPQSNAVAPAACEPIPSQSLTGGLQSGPNSLLPPPPPNNHQWPIPALPKPHQWDSRALVSDPVPAPALAPVSSAQPTASVPLQTSEPLPPPPLQYVSTSSVVASSAFEVQAPPHVQTELPLQPAVRNPLDSSDHPQQQNDLVPPPADAIDQIYGQAEQFPNVRAPPISSVPTYLPPPTSFPVPYEVPHVPQMPGYDVDGDYSYPAIDAGIPAEVDMTSPRPIISWGFPGSLLVTLPHQYGTGDYENADMNRNQGLSTGVQIVDMQQIIGETAHDDLNAAKEAVVPVDMPHRSSDLSSYADMCDQLSRSSVFWAQDQAESRSALWRLLSLMCRQVGSDWRLSAHSVLTGPPSVEMIDRSDGAPSMLSTTVPNESSPWETDNTITGNATEHEQREAAAEIEELISMGKTSDAVATAKRSDLWALALVLSGSMNKQAYNDVVTQFSSTSFTNGSALQSFLLAAAGNFEEITRKATTRGSLKQWKKTVGIMLTNRQSPTIGVNAQGGDEYLKIIGSIGDALLKMKVDVVAGHICHLLAGRLNTLDHNGVVLLGADPSVPAGRPRSIGSVAAVLQSIVLEAVLCAQGSNPFMHLLPFRLLLCNEIAALGRINIALAYCTSTVALVRSMFNSGRTDLVLQHCTRPFLLCLEGLETRLRSHTGEMTRPNVINSLTRSLSSMFLTAQKASASKNHAAIPAIPERTPAKPIVLDNVPAQPPAPLNIPSKPPLKRNISIVDDVYGGDSTMHTPKHTPLPSTPSAPANLSTPSQIMPPSPGQSAWDDPPQQSQPIGTQSPGQKAWGNTPTSNGAWMPMPPQLSLQSGAGMQQQQLQPPLQPQPLLQPQPPHQPMLQQFHQPQLQPQAVQHFQYTNQPQHQQPLPSSGQDHPHDPSGALGNERLMNFVSKTVNMLAPGGDLSPPPRHTQNAPAGASAAMNVPFGLGGQTGTRMINPSSQGMLHSASSGDIYRAPVVPMSGPMGTPVGMSRAASENEVMEMQNQLNQAPPTASNQASQSSKLAPTDQKPPRPPKRGASSSDAAVGDDNDKTGNDGKKANVSSSKFSLWGIRNRIADRLIRLHRTGKEAHLGNKSKYVYDKERGRWVIPGEEINDDDDVPPPPPDEPNGMNANDDANSAAGGAIPASVSYEDGMVSNAQAGVVRTNDVAAFAPSSGPMFGDSMARSQSVEDQISGHVGQPQMFVQNQHQQPQFIPNSMPAQSIPSSSQGMYAAEQPVGMGGYGRMYSDTASFNTTPDRNSTRLSSNSSELGYDSQNSNVRPTASGSQLSSDAESMWSSEKPQNAAGSGNTGNMVGGHRPGAMVGKQPPNNAKAVSSGNNRFRAESGRLSSRRAYVDPLNKGLNENKTVVTSAAIRPNVPLPPIARQMASAPTASAAMQPSGVNIFRPQAMPAQQQQQSSPMNNVNSQGMVNPMGGTRAVTGNTSMIGNAFGYSSNSNDSSSNMQSQDTYNDTNATSNTGTIAYSSQGKRQQQRRSLQQPKMMA